MGELTSGIAIVSALGLAVLALALGTYCCVALLMAAVVKRIRPQWTARSASLMGSSLLPVLSLILCLAAFSTALKPDFRGPEVLGIAIIGVATMFSVIVGWPVSYFVAHRVMARRYKLTI